VKRQRREVNFVRQQIENSKQFAKVPTGHVAGMAAARVFGPHDATTTTPEGHPILIMSGVFDATTETPQEAIARAAYRWLGIMPHPDHWEVEMHEQVNIAPAHPMFAKVQFNEFWHLKYTPEQWKWERRGLHAGNVPNHFRESWYLTRKWSQE
jgi:hypothetical protein